MKYNRHLFTFILFTTLGNYSYSQKLTPCRCTETGPANYGYCDSLMTKTIVNCQFDSAFSFTNGLARIIKDGKIGYMDIAGKLVIPAIYEFGEDFSDGFAFVIKGGHSFYINKTGVNQFKKNFPLPATPGRKDLIESGKKIFEQQLTSMMNDSRFYDGLAKIYDTANKKIGFIDTKGNIVLPQNYKFASRFSEGIAFIKETTYSPSTAINKNGQTVFELDINTRPRPEGFKNGFAIVVVNPIPGSYAFFNYIDKTGKLLLTEPVKKAEPFENDYAVVTDSDDDMFLINNKGAKMFDQSLGYLAKSAIKGIYFYSNDLTGGFGLIDVTGKRRTKPGYDRFLKLNDSVFLCKPWGTTLYTLVSIHSGELLFASKFTDYGWISDAKKSTIRLMGIDPFNGNVSLDYETPTGKFLKAGVEIPTKDNRNLAVNFIMREKDKAEAEKELKPGIVKYENKHFSLRFPTEMEILKDTINRIVYTKSSLNFSIEKITFKGDYLEAVKNRFQSLGKYDNLKYELLAMKQGNLNILLCNSKKEPGQTQAQFFFAVLDNERIKVDPNEMYVISGNYFVTGESIYGPQFRSTLYSLKIK